jgi:hypothetical protein
MSALSSMFRNTYLKNIKDFYENKSPSEINKIVSGTDEFDKETYKLYKMMLDNKPENLIDEGQISRIFDEQIKLINSLPVPYWKMRCMFG